MSEHPHKAQDFLEGAKHQLAQISAEFEKALGAVKDSERRKQMTSSYLELLQRGLAKAQESVAKYQEKIAPPATTELPEGAPEPDSSATPEPKATPPESGGPAS
jgi:chromosome condensin MukBEF ATPase and DNA-binding subunit MukB